MSAYEHLIKSVGMPVAERVTGWPVSKFLSELEQSQWWSPAQLRELQNEKLRDMVRHAYDTVLYYRELFDECGLTPDDIQSIEDLPKLSILTKQTIKRSFPDKLTSSEFDPGTLIMGRSSGSTGEPVKYYMTAREKGMKWACLYRMWRWAGYDFGVKFVSFSNAPQVAFRGKKLMEKLELKLMRHIILDPRQMNAANVGDYVRTIMDFKPVLVKGHPSTCYYMARYMNEHGLKFDMKAVLCNGETLVPEIRDYLQDAFGVGIWDTYGIEGMEVAGQCCPENDHHITSEAVIVEIVDGEGNPVPPGTQGRIVLTSLDKWATPFIRYDTQDLGAMLDSQCSCGRGLPLLTGIMGRMVDMGLSPSGKLLSVYFFTPLFARSEGVDAWQVVQEAPGELVVKIVPRPEFDERNLAPMLKAIEDYAGSDVAVRIERVQEIPLTPSGKRRFFISKCPISV